MQTERPAANACLTARIDLERLSQDPDLYISDINPAVEEMAQREYGLARQTPVEEDSGDEEENDAAQQQQMEEAAVTDEAMEEAFESDILQEQD